LCFGSPAFFWDFDNDGWLDIGQFVWSDYEDVIHTMEHGEGPADGNPMRIYRNNRDGTFTEVGREFGMNGCWGTMSGNCGDFNNDGHLDVVLGNGSPKMDRLDPMIVLESDGTRFRNVTFAAGFPFLGKSHGVNMADLFGDGRLSILVGAGGVYPGDLLTTNVFCPTTLPGNYLNVRLVGVKSNRSAIGARLTLRAGGKLQMRELYGGTNFGCLPLEQHFGLGTLESIDSVDVRWPSGLVQRFENLPANKTVEFVEGQDGWDDVYERARAARANLPILG
ncbi:MAG TPA: CRTAC1 family protein, partial [Bryobacteraceae bacterium]|nr:CRTAC1 family protein [Bryobacteraceae bacterium]